METNQLMDSTNFAMEFVHSLSAKWAQQFENIPEFPFLFSFNQDNLLCYNNTPLCPISNLDLNYEYIDIEWFSFGTISGDTFYFLINWPYDSDIESVSVYKEDHMISWVSTSELKLAGNF